MPSRCSARRAAALVLFCAALSACGGGGGGGSDPVAPVTPPAQPPAAPPPPSPSPAPAPPPPPVTIERSIVPSVTDGAINTALDPHVAIAPAAGTGVGKLVVFLAATEATPGDYRTLLRLGAERGYHVIGLSYVNDQSIQGLCQDSPDAQCHARVRAEIVAGEDASTLTTVTPANALLNRLTRVLQYLVQQAPDEAWSPFLAQSSPDWTRITVAGHSQGGGHAAFIAKRFAVDRAVFIGAPADWRNTVDAPPDWLSGAGATPTARQFGFAHERDPIVSLDRVRRIWDALGLDTTRVRVDSASAPYGNAQRLTTDAEAAVDADPLRYHRMLAIDTYTPRRSDGAPLFAPVWSTLMFPR